MIKNICLMGMSMVISLILVIGVGEIYIKVVIKQPKIEKNWGEEIDKTIKSPLGSVAKADLKNWKNFYIKDGKEVSGIVNFNEYRHRMSEVDNIDNRSRFATFFGCSATFGLCLNDVETIPSEFGKYAKEYVPYNLALSGWGTGQMLLTLQSGELQKEVKQQTGVGIYVYSECHIRRIIMSQFEVAHGRVHFPCYELIDTNIVYRGSFLETYPIETKLFTILGKSGIWAASGMKWPMIVPENAFELCGEMIHQSQLEFNKIWPDAKFYVVCYSIYNGKANKDLCKLVPYLNKWNIKYIPGNVTEMAINNIPNQNDRSFDGFHPTKQMSEEFSKSIVSYLDKKGEL